jgi:hypothetical protein
VWSLRAATGPSASPPLLAEPSSGRSPTASPLPSPSPSPVPSPARAPPSAPRPPPVREERLAADVHLFRSYDKPKPNAAADGGPNATGAADDAKSGTAVLGAVRDPPLTCALPRSLLGSVSDRLSVHFSRFPRSG